MSKKKTKVFIAGFTHPFYHFFRLIFLFNWLINHGYGRLSHVFRCVPLKVMGIELA